MGTKQTVVRRAVLIAAALGLLTALSGCAMQLPPILLDGSKPDLEQLTGEWTGQYISDRADAPGGSIVFTLQPGQDRAYGDVLMSRSGGRPFERYDADRPIRTLGATSQSLTILIVRTRDGFVSGELDPYWDYDRECPALTVFRGIISRDVIEGTYETTFRGPFARDTGTWRVTRRH